MARLAALVPVVALALLASACGGSRPSGVAQVGETTSQAAGPGAFSACMRSHGVLHFPDPAAGGAIPKESLQQLGVSSARYQSAESACRGFLPNGGHGPNRAQQERGKTLGFRFARCMRAHGVPNMPDPDSSGRIPDPASVNVDQGSPAFQTANQACAADRPPYIPSNAAYNAWAASHSGSGS